MIRITLKQSCEAYVFGIEDTKEFFPQLFLAVNFFAWLILCRPSYIKTRRGSARGGKTEGWDQVGIKCAPLNAKSLTSTPTKEPLVRGILLNLNANPGKKGGAKGDWVGIEGKHPQKLRCRLRDVSLRAGKHWRAWYRFERLPGGLAFIFFQP